MVSDAMVDDYETFNKENGQTTVVQNSVFNYLYAQDRGDTQAKLPD